MRIHAASRSASVTRTLEALITASGHEVAEAAHAELLLVDHHHRPATLANHLPQLVLGDAPEATQAMAIPLRPQQLLRQLAARRAAAPIPLAHGWQADATSRSITHPEGRSIALTEKESALLCVLAAAYPTALSREALLESVWGITHAIDTHTLETHIYRLRHKLGETSPAPCDILTEGGAYRLTGLAR